MRPEVQEVDSFVEQLLAEAELAVCVGAPIEAIASAAKLAEAWLKELLGLDPAERKMLGELLGEAHQRGVIGPTARRVLNQLNTRRIDALHYRGSRARVDVDDARRAVDDLASVLEEAGILSASRRREIVRRAHRQAVRHAPQEVRFHLDRSEQKGQLASLILPDTPVVAFCAHGETEQGHDDFCALASWRAREALRGRWTCVEPRWPAPGPATGTRFGCLLASLFEAATGSEPDLPQADPETDAQAWTEAVQALVDRLALSDRNWFLEHTITRPCPNDVELAGMLAERILEPLAEKIVGFCVVAIKLERATPAGWPLVSRSWWIARRDRRHVRRLIDRLETHRHAPGVAYLTLSELGSVPEDDLIGWLTRWAKLDRDSARTRARELLARTGGGRWSRLTRSLDLVEASRDARIR